MELPEVLSSVYAGRNSQGSATSVHPLSKTTWTLRERAGQLCQSRHEATVGGGRWECHDTTRWRKENWRCIDVAIERRGMQRSRLTRE